MKRAALLMIAGLAVVALLGLAAGSAAGHAVQANDARHHVDFRVGLALPFRVVWQASNGWLILGYVWALAVALGLVGSAVARALGAVGDGGRAQAGLVLCQVLLGVALSLFPVSFSGDPYAYVIHARLFGVHGINPYYVPVPLDPGSDATLRRCLEFYGNPPPGDNYGPLWTLVAGGISKLQENASLWAQVWTQRLIAVFAGVAATLALLYKRKEVPAGRRVRAVGGFALHPLVLYETGVGGHNDMLMAAAALWAFALVDELPLVAALLLGASVAVKYLSIIAVPFFLIRVARRGWASAAVAGTVALAMPVLCFKPFWLGGRTLYSLIGHGSALAMSPTWLVSAPFFFAGTVNQPAISGLGALPLVGQASWPRLLQLALVATFAVIFAVSVVQFAKAQDWRHLWRSVTAFVWSAPIVHPWYALWLTPAAAGTDRWGVFAWWFGAAVFLRYALDATPLASSGAWGFGVLAALTIVMFAGPIVLARNVLAPAERRAPITAK